MREETQEQEANAFAMELLMPEGFVRAEVQTLGGVDLCDDRKLKKLAAIFQVPLAVMAIRLTEIYK